MKPLPSCELLNELLVLDVENGKLYWKARQAHHFPKPGRISSQGQANAWNALYAGKEAFGASDPFGYRLGAIGRVQYRAHRIIFKMVNGYDPEFIDHIDGDRANNRPWNLRDVNNETNGRNQSRPKNNTSGYMGVCYSKRAKRWQAQIRIGDKTHWLGYHDTAEAAAAARVAADRRFGFHENHGR